jgi:hypothetical protein
MLPEPDAESGCGAGAKMRDQETTVMSLTGLGRGEYRKAQSSHTRHETVSFGGSSVTTVTTTEETGTTRAGDHPGLDRD